MKLYSCSTNLGWSKFLFTTDEHQASQLFGIYIVLAKAHPTKLCLTEHAAGSAIPVQRQHLTEALSRGIEGFASYEDGVGWAIWPIQEEFDKLSADAGVGDGR